MTSPTVAECRATLLQASVEQLPGLIARFEDDTRSGVANAVVTASKRLEQHLKERERLHTLGAIERNLRGEGFARVAGADEVGRGALAGPLTVAAVVLPPDAVIEGLNDSKKLAPPIRERLAEQIREVAVSFSVAHIEAERIDAVGMTRATREALIQVLELITPPADHIVVDGLGVGGLPIPETAVVAGDALCAAVAAASVVAKVVRDQLMRDFDARYPQYGFAINKGYGTREHLDAIHEHGLCPLHRRSFSPCGGTMPLF